MPNFSELFEKANWEPIEYNGKTVILLDKFPVKNEDVLLTSIEKTNSDDRQGLSIDITGYCELEGEKVKTGKGVRLLFWEDTAPKQIHVKVFTKTDFVWVENIWENISHTGAKSVDYGRYGSAMIVEEIPNGRRYRCNDWHPDENFDDIVFTIQKIDSSPQE
ncbi:MAG TPA: hypothetical protein PKW79_00690 [Rhabdochlamydiaceae bacterium]|nr:hypothetical protein [Rhabdochlamydiaceae bacterium]